MTGTNLGFLVDFWSHRVPHPPGATVEFESIYVYYMYSDYTLALIIMYVHLRSHALVSRSKTLLPIAEGRLCETTLLSSSW